MFLNGFGPGDFYGTAGSVVSLYLHRISYLGDVLELHVLLSFWTRDAGSARQLAGLVMQRIEQEPIVPPWLLMQPDVLQVKLRRSDEEPRQVWKMVTDAPLQLSLAYIATVSSQAVANEAAPDPRAAIPEMP